MEKGEKRIYLRSHYSFFAQKQKIFHFDAEFSKTTNNNPILAPNFHKS